MVAQRSLATSMNAKILGSGPETVVLAHGFGGDQTMWDKIVPFFVHSKYQVLVFDWAFSGAVEDASFYDPVKHGSYEGFASDLVGVLDEMKVMSTVFVGHSMSGMIGCLASIERPELFQKLILLAASPRYLNTDDFEGGFKASEVEQLISNIQPNYLDWTTRFAPLVMGGPDHEVSVDMFQKCLLRMRPEVTFSVAKTVFYSDHRDILDKVPVPCAIIQAKNDIAVPNSAALYMQKRINEGNSVATLDMMEVNGHFPHLTAHEQLIDVLASLFGTSAMLQGPVVNCE